MKLVERKNALVHLGQLITEDNEYLQAVVHRTSITNGWFIKEHCWMALLNIKKHFLHEEALDQLTKQYKFSADSVQQTVGIVMAGNIPLVGFQDFAACFLAGFHQKIKLSQKDEFLLPALVKILAKSYPNILHYIEFVETLDGFNKVIATGSNNTARYFEKYFSKVPNIIRKNRTSVAVLSGKETDEELEQLGKDVFSYFGLGCRNVSTLLVPKGYEFDKILELWHDRYKNLILNSKYKNNFDYNFAIFALNKEPFLHNGCLIVRNSNQLFSRIAEIHYHQYDRLSDVKSFLTKHQSTIQIIVSHLELNYPSVAFGKTQEPGWSDFPDNKDVFRFLLE